MANCDEKIKQIDDEIEQVENLAKEGDKREKKDKIVRIKFTEMQA